METWVSTCSETVQIRGRDGLVIGHLEMQSAKGQPKVPTDTLGLHIVHVELHALEIEFPPLMVHSRKLQGLERLGTQNFLPYCALGDERRGLTGARQPGRRTLAIRSELQCTALLWKSCKPSPSRRCVGEEPAL